jgi:hypothetical protein
MQIKNKQTISLKCKKINHCITSKTTPPCIFDLDIYEHLQGILWQWGVLKRMIGDILFKGA